MAVGEPKSFWAFFISYGLALAFSHHGIRKLKNCVGMKPRKFWTKPHARFSANLLELIPGSHSGQDIAPPCPPHRRLKKVISSLKKKQKTTQLIFGCSTSSILLCEKLKSESRDHHAEFGPSFTRACAGREGTKALKSQQDNM